MKTYDISVSGALPPAPGPAGAPGQTGLSPSVKTGARRCRDCGVILSECGIYLCGSCRAVALAKRRARKREHERNRYKTALASGLTKPAVPKCARNSVRTCATLGCTKLVEGREVYCEACRRVRRNEAQQAWRVREEYVDPLPQGPPTSMEWLGKFDGWARSGLSYGAYQAAERNSKKSKRKGKNERRDYP